ncbi:MAG: histidine kinase dimerization/phospho-acceptor domain-containing protein, partial [Planctomycetota bacterium]
MWVAVSIVVSVALVVSAAWAAAAHVKARRLARDDAAGRERTRQLSERLVAVERRRSELEAVLSSMVEGVAAIDTEERLISLNRAAAQLLSLDPTRAVGRPIQEVVRNTALQSLVAEALNASDAAPASVELALRHRPGSTADERTLRAVGAPVRDAEGRRVGAVVVMHDVTRLRRLESVRRDFVANVSHEIKTPISAVKAAVETLLEDPDMPAAPRQNFTGVIARQTDRLDAIVEDLLALTRLEQENGRAGADLEPHPVGPAVAAACETCDANAVARSIELVVEVGDLHARCVPTLLEQALVNLIDNAVKYSPEGTTVRITAERRGDEVVVSVIDQGRGIEP